MPPPILPGFTSHVFIIGGGVSRAGELLREPAVRSYRRHLTARWHRPAAAVRMAELGPEAGIGPYIRNSLVAAGISTVIAVVLGCLAGYGLARSRYRGKDHVAFWIISQRMAPIAVVLLPLFVIFRFTGLLGSTSGLIVAYLTFNLSFAIWIMNAFFSELNPSLEEAAMIDGATRWSAFRDVALPLVLPGIATTAILCLVFSWNDYAFAVTFSGPDSQTLPIAASQLVTQTSIDWGQLTTIGTIVVAPMILVGLIVHKWLVTGLTLGAVTGE